MAADWPVLGRIRKRSTVKWTTARRIQRRGQSGATGPSVRSAVGPAFSGGSVFVRSRTLTGIQTLALETTMKRGFAITTLAQVRTGRASSKDFDGDNNDNVDEGDCDDDCDENDASCYFGMEDNIEDGGRPL